MPSPIAAQMVKAIGLKGISVWVIDVYPSSIWSRWSPADDRADHRWVLSYNGEIYNYRELRTELEAEGVGFAAKLIVKLY